MFKSCVPSQTAVTGLGRTSDKTFSDSSTAACRSKKFFARTLVTASVATCAVLAAGCSSAPKFVPKGGVNYNFSREVFQNALYMRLRYSNSAVEVTEVSANSLVPTGKDEEVLAYSPTRGMIGPAFGTSTGYGDTFVCKMLDPTTKWAAYHPCSSGSRFVSAAVGKTVITNVILVPISLGLYSSKSVDLDRPALDETVVQLGIKRIGDEYLETRRFAAQLTDQLNAHAKEVRKNLTVKTTVENMTAFQAPSITDQDVGVTLTIPSSFSVPDTIQYRGPETFASIRKQMEQQAQALVSKGEFKVECRSRYYRSSFEGRVYCPETLVYRSGSEVLTTKVQLQTYSGGTRFPSLNKSDRVLSVEVENNSLVVENLSSQYVEVSAITVYGGEHVLNTTVNMSLAPESRNSAHSMEQYAGPTITRLFTFDKVSRVTGSRNFGVAIKYRVGSGGNFETLLLRRNVQLASLF